MFDLFLDDKLSDDSDADPDYKQQSTSDEDEAEWQPVICKVNSGIETLK